MSWVGLPSVGLAVAGADHPQPGQPVLPEVDHEVLGEGVDVVEPGVGPVGEHVDPVGPARCGHGGPHEAEVLGLVVGQHEEALVLMLD
jgi:hypothetical protein